MKNLIYSSALLCVFLFSASCNKNDALKPVTKSDASKPITKNDTLKSISAPVGSLPACDSSKMVTYQFTNLTGDDTYELAFAGRQNYTFIFPANGTKTVSVKPGTYNIFIYSPGNYTVHGFSLNGQADIRESGARYDSINVTSCNGVQAVMITK